MRFERLASIALLFCSIAVAFTIGELIIRITIPQQLVRLPRQIWQADSELGWKHLEGLNETVNTGERPVHLITDNRGFRIGRRSSSDTASVRILAIGDSFIEALQVEHENTLTEVLSRKLSATSRRTVRIANGGVGGWSPYQYRIFAERELARMSYDMGIIFLYAGNDFRTSARPISGIAGLTDSSSTAGGTRNWENSLISILKRVNGFLERRSHLFVFLKDRTHWILARVGLTAYYFPDVFRTDVEHGDRWTFTARQCELTKTAFTSRGADVLFVLIPAPYQVDRHLLEEYVAAFSIPRDSVDIQLPNRMAESYIDGVIDLLPCLLRTARVGNRLFGRVDRHFSPEGHEAVASCLEPHVRTVIERRLKTE